MRAEENKIMTEPQMTLDILKRARALLTPPGAWTQTAFARDRDGEPINADSEAAISWCSAGALEASKGGKTRWRAQNHLKSAISTSERSFVSEWSVLTWNDNPDRTQKEVLAAFDKAIAMASHD